MKKVILVGKAEGWEKAPDLWNKFAVHQEGQYSVWGVNDVCLRRHVNLIFEMHDIDREPWKSDKFVNLKTEYAKLHNIPIVMQKEYEQIPSSIRFPLECFKLQYFTCSIDYMIAYALLMEYTHIEMYGIAMGGAEEYVRQKAGVHFWLGYVMGNGVSITINQPSALLKEYRGMYGYRWDVDADKALIERVGTYEDKK